MGEHFVYEGSLHCHSDYSNFRLRDSINTIPKLFDRAIELGHTVLALTDHETTSGWIKAQQYYKTIKNDNPDFKLILGNEIYLVRDGLDKTNFDKTRDKYYHFILLAKDEVGAHQLMEISTRAWKRAYESGRIMRVPTYYQDLIDIVGANPGHIIASTACIGGCLGTQLLRYRDSKDSTLWTKILKWVDSVGAIFGQDNFYLELQPSTDEDQIYVNRMILAIAAAKNLPFIITNDAHYPKKEDLRIEEIFLKAQNGEREVASFYGATYLMDTREILSRMSYMKESELLSAFNSIRAIKDACKDYDLTSPLVIPCLKWREFEHCDTTFYEEKMPMLKNFLTSKERADNELAYAVIAGIKTHQDLQSPAAYNELNLCLRDTWISSQTNNALWSAYFLNLQKILDECWNAGTIVGCGRGSGVGFLLLYALDITQINPLREKTKTFRFRFLNPDRVSVLDIDSDISGLKRAQILKHLREVYGEENVANVLTLGTEKSKSAIQSAARGLGIDNDIAAYLSSMVESDRGQLRTLKQTFYGDEENGMTPNMQFRHEMQDNYPELWEVAQAIEGLIVRSGIHAGGVIFVDKPFTNFSALMRAPSGEIITQFELNNCQDVSLIKYDLLSVEGIDRIQTCLDLLCDYGYVERKSTLRETYNNAIGIYKLDRTNPEMWDLLNQHKVQALFQMEGQTGIQGIDELHPTSVDDLAVLNSTLRLMAQKKGDEMPTTKLSRFKRDPSLWIKETQQYGVTKEQRDVLWSVLSTSYGLCIAQEQFMQLVQLPELGGFSLTWADKLRKAIAHKNPKDYDKLGEEFYKVTADKKIDKQFAFYVWQVLIAMSKGYAFNQSHTLAYSLIALQELNLAYHYPIIFWNTACLIVDSGGDEVLDFSEDEDEKVFNTEDPSVSDISTIDFSENDEDTDEDDQNEEDEEDAAKTKIIKKKTKVKATNYGKIAIALGKIKTTGVKVSPPDINTSTYTFSPNVERNEIRFGLSGITRIGDDIITKITARRPYSSFQDFISKVPLTKPQAINLIKSGAFDCFDDRIKIMRTYIMSVSDTKKRITLQNLKMLIDFGLIPDKYDLQRKVYMFNKYIRKFKTDTDYILDETAFPFYEQHFDLDLVRYSDENVASINQLAWEKIYQSHMDIIRPYVKENAAVLLEQVNENLISNMWNKYCIGNISRWEMESISCYLHAHELECISFAGRGISDFDTLPEQPRIDTFVRIKGNSIPLYCISRIVGTVIGKDKIKKTVSILTTSGVVTVKIFGQVFTNYDKQISQKGEDGHKHVIEKSWFTRGNKIIITGIRRGGFFMAKKYARTPYHLVELITNIDQSTDKVETIGTRADATEE